MKLISLKLSTQCKWHALFCFLYFILPLSADVFGRNEPIAIDGSHPCQSQGELVNERAFENDCFLFSDFRFFNLSESLFDEPNEGVLSYSVNVPLFTDYADKWRYIYMPWGAEIEYQPYFPFEFPVGTALIKVFGYPLHPTERNKNADYLEIRLLIHRSYGWVPLVYLWNEEAGDAFFIESGWLGAFPSPPDPENEIRYQVPKRIDCQSCHRVQTVSNTENPIAPIGPSAFQLNKKIEDSADSKNQLEIWKQLGWIKGMPENSRDIPRFPNWNDATDGTIEARARSYLHANCAHCHNPNGKAGESGLFLEAWRNPRSKEYGYCKKNAGSENRDRPVRVIVPGKPSQSIILFRMNATTPGAMMPPLGRSVVDRQALSLIHQWIENMADVECDSLSVK